MPAYDEKYIKSKVRQIKGGIKKTFWVLKKQKITCIMLALPI